jgi:hypothetical protein
VKHTLLVLLLILFGSVALAAQSANQHPVQSIVVVPPNATSTCPVSLRAQQRAAGDVREVDNSRPKGIAQLLHLAFTNADPRAIKSVTVTVHGLSGKSHIVQTLSTSDSTDAARTLDVMLAAESGREVAADLWVPGLSAVRTISLESISYADGSTWKLAGESGCSTLIDGFMPIDSH